MNLLQVQEFAKLDAKKLLRETERAIDEEYARALLPQRICSHGLCSFRDLLKRHEKLIEMRSQERNELAVRVFSLRISCAIGIFSLFRGWMQSKRGCKPRRMRRTDCRLRWNVCRSAPV